MARFSFNPYEGVTSELPWPVHRTDGSVSDVADRLDDRISKNLGNYVALVTEAPIGEDGTPNERQSTLRLYAKNGESSLWCRYLVGDCSYPNGTPRPASVMSVPIGWPNPVIEDIIQRARKVLPSEYYITNGERTWPHDKMPRRDLADEMWPGRERLLLSAPGARATLITDIDRPELLGIYTERRILLREDTCQRVEEVFWIATDRDDVPVETLSRDYAADGETVQFEVVTNYFCHARLSNHMWYPSNWRTMTKSANGGRDHRESHLQLFDGMILDNSWFVDPKQWGLTVPLG